MMSNVDHHVQGASLATKTFAATTAGSGCLAFISDSANATLISSVCLIAGTVGMIISIVLTVVFNLRRERILKENKARVG